MSYFTRFCLGLVLMVLASGCCSAPFRPVTTYNYPGNYPTASYYAAPAPTIASGCNCGVAAF